MNIYDTSWTHQFLPWPLRFSPSLHHLTGLNRPTSTKGITLRPFSILASWKHLEPLAAPETLSWTRRQRKGRPCYFFVQGLAGQVSVCCFFSNKERQSWKIFSLCKHLALRSGWSSSPGSCCVLSLSTPSCFKLPSLVIRMGCCSC
jgi:hypothetical protein